MTREETVMDIFRNFLAEAKWEWSEQEPITFRGMIGGESGRWGWMAHCHNDGEFLTMLSTVPQNVPARKRAAAMEYLTRANFQMTTGAFEMDLSDGQVNCRTAVPGDGLTPGGISFLVFANFMVMDRFMPGLLSVIYGKTSPLKAIEMLETDSTASSPPENEADSQAVVAPPPPSLKAAGKTPIPTKRSPLARRRRLFPGGN
jgi:hypothetical protein